MSRPKFSPLMLAMASALLTENSVVAAEPAKKLNVLLIVVDDLNTDLGCYGSKSSVAEHRSPGVPRRPLRPGLLPIRRCAPSRWSFLSGLRPETTGIFEFKTLLAREAAGRRLPAAALPPKRLLTAGMGKVFHDNAAERSGDIVGLLPRRSPATTRKKTRP